MESIWGSSGNLKNLEQPVLEYVESKLPLTVAAMARCRRNMNYYFTKIILIKSID